MPDINRFTLKKTCEKNINLVKKRKLTTFCVSSIAKKHLLLSINNSAVLKKLKKICSKLGFQERERVLSD